MRHPDELLRGVLIAGSVGSGKTERSLSIVSSALDLDYGVLAFDPSNDYQRALHEYEDGVVIDFSEYYMNPLEPPTGLSLEDWSPVFIQVFAQTFGLKDPSIAILQKSMKNLMETSQNEQPILSELLDEVTEFQPRPRSSETSSHASVQNRLESVLDSEWGRCLDVRNGFSPRDFEEGLLVVKLRPVGIERVHELVVGLTVAKIFAYRSWRQNRGEPLGKNIFVVIEEAHRFLSEGRQGDRRGQTLYLERALVESRKLGVGFSIVDQMPHRISDYVLGSCNLWVVCRLMDPNSRRVVGEALRTDVVWSHIGLMELPVGGAIIRVENQRELEETSPLIHRDEKFLYDVKGLPATVALPASPESLFPPLESCEIWERMVKNERYMRYFERVVTQDYHRIKKTLQESEKASFQEFIARTIGVQSDESEPSDLPTHFVDRSPMDRFQIDECKQLLGVLASEIQTRLLQSISESEKASISQLESVSRSSSWISRNLRKMVTFGIAQRKSGNYSLTQKGERVLHWGQLMSRGAENPNLEFPFTEIETDQRWLLSMIGRYREQKEKTTVAGWKGSQESRDEILRVEYLLHYTAEQERAYSTTKLEIDYDFFRALKTSMESEVLFLLLLNERPLRLEHITRKSRVSDRSIRRQLKLMEGFGVVDRIWHDGKKGIELRNHWRTMFRYLVSKQESRTSIPARLLQKSLRLVWDYVLFEWLSSRTKIPESWETIKNLNEPSS
jgi:predicted transcriptional regulator